MSVIFSMRLIIVLCGILFSMTPLHSAPIETATATATAEFSIINANQQFDKINLQLSVQNLKLSALNNAIETLSKLTAYANQCVDDAQKKIDNLNNLIKPTTTTRAEEATSPDLVYLNKQQKKWSTTQAQCRLFSIRAHEAIEAYKRAALKLKEQATLVRGMPLWTLYHEVITAPESGIQLATLRINPPEDTMTAWSLKLLTTAGLALLFSFALLRWLSHRQFNSHYFRFKQVHTHHVFVFAACLLSGVLFIDMLATHFIVTDDMIDFFPLFRVIFFFFCMWSGLIFLFKITSIRALFYWYDIDHRFVRACLFFFISIYWLAKIGLWLHATGALSTPFWQWIESLFILGILSISFTYITYYCRFNQDRLWIQRHQRLILNLTALLILVPTVLTFLGYISLSIQLIYACIMIFILLFFASTIIHGMEKLYKLIHQNKVAHAQVCSYFGYKKEQALTEFLILKITGQLIVCILGLFFIAKATGFPSETIDNISEQFLNGFHVANMVINPTRILTGIIFFCLIYLSARALSNQLGHQEKFDEEEETQVAVASILTYLGFTAALITGLLIAGFNFTGLALIAGALSVGIGLGLQSIVNNFVSGLILLIEKPIKPGDRINIDGIDGFVKKIRIRSTQLITPSREDIIIPNSDLITRRVTNYMLTDKLCRISFTIGVAYGSNTTHVRDTLLEVADMHDDVIKTQRNKPIVLFTAFGESELVFELSCLIKDVNKKASIHSELHFEIERLFRERNIDMPFPQPEIYIKSKDF